MAHEVSRRFTNAGIHIETQHLECGPIQRGKVVPERRRIEGAGAYMVWRTVDSDHNWSDLFIAGDYLTAEQALLDRTAWAEEPAGPDPDEH